MEIIKSLGMYPDGNQISDCLESDEIRFAGNGFSLDSYEWTFDSQAERRECEKKPLGKRVVKFTRVVNEADEVLGWAKICLATITGIACRERDDETQLYRTIYTMRPASTSELEEFMVSTGSLTGFYAIRDVSDACSEAQS